MSNQNQNQTDRPNKQYNNTSKLPGSGRTLGLLTDREADTVGYVVDPDELSTCVATVFAKLNVRTDDIKAVYATSDGRDGAELVMVVNKHAVTGGGSHNQDDSDWLSGGYQSKTKIRSDIFNELRGKLYEKKLQFRQTQHKNKKFIEFRFDLELAMAYLFDINYYDDANLKVAVSEVKMNKKKRKNLGHPICDVYVRGSKNRKGFKPVG